MQNARTALQGADVRDPMKPRAELLPVRALTAEILAKRLRPIFRSAVKFSHVSPTGLLVVAPPAELERDQAIGRGHGHSNAGSDTGAAHRRSRARHAATTCVDVARALEKHVEGLRASVSGSTVVLVGAPDSVARAKSLVAEIDVPAFGDKYTTVYRIRTIDASSLADLLRRSFHDLEISVDAPLNALAVTATAAQRQRIVDAIAQLDPPPAAAGAVAPSSSGWASSTEVITLNSYVPGNSQGTVDATASFTQALPVVPAAPDVRVVQLPTPGQIALVGPPPACARHGQRRQG